MTTKGEIHESLRRFGNTYCTLSADVDEDKMNALAPKDAN